MIKKYRKKPVEVKAIQWDGTNLTDIINFVGNSLLVKREKCINGKTFIYIHTLEGDMEVNLFDQIIQGVNGEFYPCKPDIFEKTYDEVI